MGFLAAVQFPPEMRYEPTSLELSPPKIEEIIEVKRQEAAEVTQQIEARNAEQIVADMSKLRAEEETQKRNETNKEELEHMYEALEKLGENKDKILEAEDEMKEIQEADDLAHHRELQEIAEREAKSLTPENPTYGLDEKQLNEREALKASQKAEREAGTEKFRIARDQLAVKIQSAPEDVQNTHLANFDNVAKLEGDALASRQEAEGEALLSRQAAEREALMRTSVAEPLAQEERTVIDQTDPSRNR